MKARRLSRITVLAVAGLVGSAVGAGLAGVAQAADPEPSRTVLTSTTPAVSAGQDVKLKAIAKAVTGTDVPTGSVTFNEGATVLGTVDLALVGTSETAKLTVSGLGVGTHQITATYGGDSLFAGSTSLPLAVTVNLPATITKATPASQSVLIGKDAKIKAVVKMAVGPGVPTGTVTFTEGTTTLGVVNLALVGQVDTAKLTISKPALGTHTIIATYSGSATLAPSTSTAITVTVVKATTSTTITATPDATGGTYTLSALVDALAPATGVPTGTVRFVIDGLAPQIVAVNQFGKAPLPNVDLAAGVSHTVKATYSGDALNATSQGTLTFIA